MPTAFGDSELQETPERQLPHSLLLKRMKMDAKSFQEMIATLEQQGDIAKSIVATLDDRSDCTSS